MWCLKKVNAWNTVKGEGGGGSFPRLEGITPGGVSGTASDGHGLNTQVCGLSSASRGSQSDVALRCHKDQQHKDLVECWELNLP